MAIELRHRARTAERSEPIDPSQTGPRTRLPESSSTGRIDSDRPHTERHSVLPERPSAVPARRSRVTRPSVRPSAFGVPRTSAPPAPERAGSTRPREDGRLAGSHGKPAKRDSAPPHPSAASQRSLLEEARSPTEPAEDVPVSSQIVAKRPRLDAPSVSTRTPEGARARAVKTDIEELLPISQGVKSLPRPPRLPSFEVVQQPAPAPRRFPWASLAVFAVALTASLAPLFHYRVESKQTEPAASAVSSAPALLRSRAGEEAAASTLGSRAPGSSETSTAALPSDLRAPSQASASPALDKLVGVVAQPLPVSSLGLSTRAAAASPTAAERIERAFWGQPKRVQQALLAEAERALHADDERLAETLFARALDFSVDDAQSAYGLARVRLAQGDLEGAEGWVLTAIKQRPRRAEYRALHAEILQRFGRGSEAQLERALARSLPPAAPHFPAATRSR